LDGADFSLEKLVKKWFKHLIWIFLSIWTGFTFVGYFTPIRELAMAFFTTHMGSWELFWVFFYAFATYGNAGFMREQVCKYMCPYARFQSAMFDHDTLIVTYDSQRGEPRGPRSRHVDSTQPQLGACVDCTMCVQVCPTGIDIRQGLQYECISCGACADVCDSVMDKMGYARGLVRFATQNALGNNWTFKEMLQRMLRPRVQIYAMFLIGLIAFLLVSLSLRTPFKVDVVRDRSTLSRITDVGTLENVFRLQIMNASETAQTYHLSVRGLPNIRIQTEADVMVDAAQARWVVVRADIPYGSSAAGSHKIFFEIHAVGTDDLVVEKSVFIVPR
jgi:cytochrome c oxidase accessory protein FixG